MVKNTTPVVYLLLEKDGKLLVARRCNTGYRDGWYSVPSGHVEDQETPFEAAVREAKEEIGIDISPNSLSISHISYRPRHDETGNRVDFFFNVKDWDGEPYNAEPEKCDELRWVRYDELPENMTPHVERGIRESRNGVLYAEPDRDFLKQHGYYSE